VSSTTHALLHCNEDWEATGGIEVKGKGRMDTYLWVPPPHHLTTSVTAAPPTLASAMCLAGTIPAGSLQAGATAAMTIVPHHHIGLGRASAPSHPTVTGGGSTGRPAREGCGVQAPGDAAAAARQSLRAVESSVYGSSMTGCHALPGPGLTSTLPSEILVGFLPPPLPVAAATARRGSDGSAASAQAAAAAGTATPLGQSSQHPGSCCTPVGPGAALGTDSPLGAVSVDARSPRHLLTRRHSSLALPPTTAASTGPPGSLDSLEVAARAGLALALANTSGGGGPSATGRAVAQAVSVLSSRHRHQTPPPSQGPGHHWPSPDGAAPVIPPGSGEMIAGATTGPPYLSSFTSFTGGAHQVRGWVGRKTGAGGWVQASHAASCTGR
jgi:hypothetical protein